MKKFVLKVSNMNDVEQIVGEMRKSGRLHTDGMHFQTDETPIPELMHNSMPFRINLTKEFSTDLLSDINSHQLQKQNMGSMLFNDDSASNQNNQRHSSQIAIPPAIFAGHKSTSSLEKRQRISSEDHDEQLFWNVFSQNAAAAKGQLNLKVKQQPKYPTTRLLNDGYSDEQFKTLTMSKQIRSMNSAGPYDIKIRQRPRSDQVTYTHRSISKHLSNQSPTSCFGKVSSNKKQDKQASKGSKRNSPPYYQEEDLYDPEK